MPNKAVKKDEMISIIIPTYNRAHLLPRAIDSILAQTYTNWELIIVDDGSTDDTKRIVSDYLHDSRVSYCLKDNEGTCIARNFGVERARGDYLYFLDSDDKARNNTLELLLKSFSIQTVIIGRSSFNIQDLNRLFLTKPDAGKIPLLLAGNFLIGREEFTEAGGLDVDVSYGEFTEFALRILNSHNFVYCNDIVVDVYTYSEKKRRTRDYVKGRYELARILLERYKGFFERNKDVRNSYQRIEAFNALILFKIRESRLKYSECLRNEFYDLHSLKYSIILLLIGPFSLKYQKKVIAFLTKTENLI